MKFCLVYPNLDGTPQSLDMGVAYLATYIKERTNHTVRIVDPTFHRRDAAAYIRRQIEEFAPDVIGVSAPSLYFDYARRVIREIKTYCNVPVIIGGFQAIMAPDDTLAAPEFDALCTGEGESTLTEYLDALEKGTPLEGIKGLWFRKNGAIVKNESREVNPDLDSLPMPDYDLFEDIDKYLYYLRRLYVIGSRGCPYTCTFCAESVLYRLNPGKRFRERNPENYVREIETLYRKYGPRGMRAAHLYDSVFSYNQDWLKAWSSEYIKRGLHRLLPYSCFLKADPHNASEDRLQMLEESGCVQVRIGVESGDDEVRESIINKKGGTGADMRAIIRSCNQHGFIVKTYSILGVPGDTRVTIRKTFDFCRTPLIQIPLVFSYTPLPNTPLAQKVEMMNEASSSEKMYSFHYSKGARNKGVPEYYVPWMILRSYFYFGSRLGWNMFVSNPLRFFPIMISRILKGFVWGCPLLSTSGYALISPDFWPSLSRRIKKRWAKSA